MGVLARDAFTYLHIPIVAGILVMAVGDAIVIAHPGCPLHGEQLAALLTGPVLYMRGHIGFELRMTGSVPPTRAGAALVVIALALLATVLPVVATWALVNGTLTVVAGLETYAPVGPAGGRAAARLAAFRDTAPPARAAVAARAQVTWDGPGRGVPEAEGVSDLARLRR